MMQAPVLADSVYQINRLSDTSAVLIIMGMIRDIFAAFAWPITILVIFIIFRKPINLILHFMVAFVKDLDEVYWGNVKLKTKKGITQVPNESPKLEEPIDKNTVDQITDSKILSGDMERRILSTLWHYQKLHNKPGERWTFTLSAYNPEFLEFYAAIPKLTSRGLVAQDTQSQQFLLTDFGILFCKQHEADLKGPLFEFH
jgi:hypothetical protein